MKDSGCVNWYLKAQLFQQKIPTTMMSWLMDESSLTERLIASSSEPFSVKVLKQKWVKPSRSERLLLSLGARKKVLLRQVALYCGDKPVVFANSLIPVATLKGEHKRLACLKNQSLGKYLFSKTYLRRSTLQWSSITQSSPLYPMIAEQYALPDRVWGRRSLFHLKTKKLLVCEYFLPTLLSM